MKMKAKANQSEAWICIASLADADTECVESEESEIALLGIRTR